jgi:oligopeptide/dipeptide ABC transporter ATP-binding protein
MSSTLATTDSASGHKAVQRPPLLRVRDVSRIFSIDKGKQLVANDHINLTLDAGKTIALVGESGCGKSTIGRQIAMLDHPSGGQILFDDTDITRYKGEQLRLARKKVQMVFQDPGLSLNPAMKVGELICEPLLNFKMIDRSQCDEAASRLLQRVGLPAGFRNRYPHMLSGGQRQRVAIARAIAPEPELLVCDEATSALDVSAQEGIAKLLVELQRQTNMAMIFICHDLCLARLVAHTIAIMYLGNVVEITPGVHFGCGMMHPYSQALFDSIFTLDMDFSTPIKGIEGEVPSPLNAPKGCPFASRCRHKGAQCAMEKPALRDVGNGHRIACHLPEEDLL